jgi:peptidoglycan/LPS O-acetylase OafA/YrhL
MSPRRARLPGLDGLRALAAASVLVYHCWLYSSRRPVGGPVATQLFPYLALGVTLFFTLSGFLLWRPFARSLLERRSSPATGRYLRNRALRILPAYWVVLVVCGLVLGGSLVRQSSTLVSVGRLDDPLRFLDAAVLLQNLQPATLQNGLGPAWTLAVEVAFYLALPAFALVCSRLVRRRDTDAGRRLATALPAAALLAIGLTGKLVTGLISPMSHGPGQHLPAGSFLYPADWHTILQLSVLAQADLFAFGMLLAVVHVEHERGAITLSPRWRLTTFAAACLVGIPSLLAVHGQQLAASPANTGVALTFALLLALVVIDPRDHARSIRMLQSRPLLGAGLASYSVFLWNDPIERLLERHGLTVGGLAGLPVNMMVLGLIVGFLSLISYRLVERPALQRRSVVTPRAAPAPVGAGVP